MVSRIRYTWAQSAICFPNFQFRKICSARKAEQAAPSFQQVPEPTPLQAKAYALLDLLPVAGNLILTYLQGYQQDTAHSIVELRTSSLLVVHEP